MSEYLSITQLNRTIKQLFEQTPFLKRVTVLGEVSNFKKHSSGTLYFTLKDADSDLKAVMFQSNASKLSSLPQNGQQVLATGDVSVYEARGEYQIYVSIMRPFGAGDIYARLEALKALITKEGLLDPSRKKPLPKYPRVVGVITSPTGAAIQDIQHTIERRFPLATLRLYPALVQGDDARFSIVEQIQKANLEAKADVLIVGRGVGSIEDLWAFNEEIVVRAIAASDIPVISAVGHETDTTLADFVADMRAPTPTAAAEMAVPDQAEIQQQIATTVYHMKQRVAGRWQEAARQLERLKRSYVFTTPERLLERKQYQLDRLFGSLQTVSPTAKLDRLEQRRDKASTLLQTLIDKQVETASRNLLQQVTSLKALNPKAVLQRGYAMVEVSGTLVDSIDLVKESKQVDITLKDGQFSAEVLTKRRT